MCEILNQNQFNMNYVEDLNGNLYNVKKGVYLMSAVYPGNNNFFVSINQGQRKHLYRFGIVGERNRNNDANSRLSQCTYGWRKKNHLGFGDEGLKWKYSLLGAFDDEYPSDLLQLIESIVRVHINRNNSFERFAPEDAFLTANEDEIVCNEFMNILANHCGIALPQ